MRANTTAVISSPIMSVSFARRPCFTRWQRIVNIGFLWVVVNQYMVKWLTIVRQLMVLVEQRLWQRGSSLACAVNDCQIHPLDISHDDVHPTRQHANDYQRGHKSAQCDHKLTTETSFHVK